MSERVDSTPVTQYAGVFSGSFDVEPMDTDVMKYDREITLVVTARVRAPRFKETKEGDLVRVNVLGVREVAVVKDDAFRTQILQRLNLQELAQLPLYPSASSSGSVDETDDSSERPLEDEEPEEEVFRPGSSRVAQMPSSGDPALRRFLSEPVENVR